MVLTTADVDLVCQTVHHFVQTMMVSMSVVVQLDTHWAVMASLAKVRHEKATIF